MKIEIYTDGACSGNPGKGGYGILMRVPEKIIRKHFQRLPENHQQQNGTFSCHYCFGKTEISDNEIHIYTDSKYVADAINQNWLSGWIKRGWKNVKIPICGKNLLTLQYTQPKMHWIKGHAGHFENELCDKLAVTAAASENLEIDSLFENLENNTLF
jgi:ribonuclease HI